LGNTSVKSRRDIERKEKVKPRLIPYLISWIFPSIKKESVAGWIRDKEEEEKKGCSLSFFLGFAPSRRITRASFGSRREAIEKILPPPSYSVYHFSSF
jgi:hypothetical protein